MKMFSLDFIRLKVAALPQPLRIGMGLGLGFAVTLSLVVLVMIVGFGFMAKIYTDMDNMAHVNNVKTELAHQMKDAQRERAISLYSLALIADPFEKDEELQRFNRMGSEFLQAREKFYAKGVNELEQAQFERIRNLIQARGRVVGAAVEYAMGHHGLAAAEMMRKEAIPGQHGVAREIDKLLVLQQEQTNQSVVNAAESYLNARFLMLWLCSFAVVAGMLVAAIVLREVMRQSRQLEHKALFDDLTGLPNRALFFDRLAQAASAYEKENKPFSIVVVDLDRFKEINDSQGHYVGDLVLKHVAQKLSGTMRRTDTIARMASDEFVLLMPGAAADSAEIIVEKVLSSLCQRVSLDGNMVNIAASMGIACYPEHDKDISRLLLKADIAMYAAKRSNVGYRIYTPEIEAVAARNVELEHELRDAIENQQLTLHYQPKISHHTGCIMGVEALVRWNHPARGMVAPDEFIPLAEATGLIQPLALWVLQTALQQSKKWHDAGHVFTVAVNLSTRNLLDGDLPARVGKLLASYEVRPEWLVFEITESAVMAEPMRALETLVKLNDMGIQLSLDDFGTGYSSLAYLKKLPVNEIKIDKSFIKDMEIDASDTVIVRSTIALGHNLGMKVVAEGVENMQIWDMLTTLGCDASQGYYMSRPLEVSSLDEWMNTSAWASENSKPSPGQTFPAERRKNLIRLYD